MSSPEKGSLWALTRRRLVAETVERLPVTARVAAKGRQSKERRVARKSRRMGEESGESRDSGDGGVHLAADGSIHCHGVVGGGGEIEVRRGRAGRAGAGDWGDWEERLGGEIGEIGDRGGQRKNVGQRTNGGQRIDRRQRTDGG